MYTHTFTVKTLLEAATMLEHMAHAYTLIVPEQTENTLSRLRTWRNLLDSALLEIKSNIRRDKEMIR
ncbi:MAG: hypothetical protein Tp1100DCM51572_71 [Prokaryotic dsDNA virus sp.]|nr:MAG: hypothetical protein Tp1100DCM51572_71 [Prokaryotic dsDNA virus sp.]